MIVWVVDIASIQVIKTIGIEILVLEKSENGDSAL